jgi:hypothetical protein
MPQSQIDIDKNRVNPFLFIPKATLKSMAAFFESDNMIWMGKFLLHILIGFTGLDRIITKREDGVAEGGMVFILFAAIVGVQLVSFDSTWLKIVWWIIKNGVTVIGGLVWLFFYFSNIKYLFEEASNLWYEPPLSTKLFFLLLNLSYIELLIYLLLKY